MLQFIITNIFFLSTGAVLFIIARSLPRVHEDADAPKKHRFMERLIASELPERVDATFNAYLKKLLMRIKVFLLKVDNLITKRLGKIKSDNETSKSQISFEEIVKEKREEEAKQ